MHKTTDHLANQNNSNELDTTSLERAQDLELVQDKFQIENDIAPKSSLMLCDFASGFCFLNKVCM